MDVNTTATILSRLLLIVVLIMKADIYYHKVRVPSRLHINFYLGSNRVSRFSFSFIGAEVIANRIYNFLHFFFIEQFIGSFITINLVG